MSAAVVQADPLNAITEQIIGAAMEVHRAIGPAYLNQPTKHAWFTNFASAACALSCKRHFPLYTRALGSIVVIGWIF
jgi:hypothetical protein